MWEIGLKSQAFSFATALITGIIFSVIFDVLRALRRCVKHSAVAVFIEDVLFFIIAALFTFLLLIARCNGEVRAYMLLGIFFGFFFYRFTLSRLFLFGLSLKIFMLIARIFQSISTITGKFGELVELKIDILIKKIKKMLKNINFNRKNS